MAPNGLKSFPSAFSEGDTSPSAKNTSIFDDPLQGGARDNKPDLLVAASKQRAAASALVTDISTDVRCDSNDRLVTEEYLRSPEFNVEEQSLLGDNSNYDEDAVEGAKVQLTGPKTTEDVLGGNFSASVSQEVDAMRRRTSATVGSGKDRSFSDNVSDVATSAHGSENGEMVEKSTGFYEVSLKVNKFRVGQRLISLIPDRTSIMMLSSARTIFYRCLLTFWYVPFPDFISVNALMQLFCAGTRSSTADVARKRVNEFSYGF